MKYEGTGIPPLILQPAQCKRETAGYIGPCLSLASLKATPQYYPLSAKLSVPVSIFKQHPRIPYFLNLLPYAGPLAFELCLSWPSPRINKKNTIIGKSKRIITKRGVNIKLPWSTDPNLKLILSFAISNNFPIINSLSESNISQSTSKNVRLLFQKDQVIALGSRYANAQT